MFWRYFELDWTVEERLRLLFGVPFSLLGVWVTKRCDRAFAKHFGWRGLLLGLAALGLIFTSFVLLLFRGSLFDLWELL